MIIRAAFPEDALGLATIHAACFDVAWSHETIANFIDTAQVVITGDPPLGFLIVQQVLDEAEIITLAVHPSARQQGLARALLDDKMADLASQGVRHVFLEVATDNGAALHLYKALGFVETGVRKAYYRRAAGAMVDASVLSRALQTTTIVANS